MQCTRRGFTMIETILSLSLIAAITAISLPIYQSFQVKNDTDLARTTIVQALRRAQLLSQAMEHDSAWGVYITSGGATLYKGDSFVTRDAAYDESYSLPASIQPRNTIDIPFTKLTGFSATEKDTMLISTNGDTATIFLNTRGAIQY